jgi:hypothetical protein
MPLAASWSLTARSGISRKEYSGTRFDETRFETALGLMKRTPIGYWGIETIGSRELAQDRHGRHRPMLDSYGMRAYGRFVPSSAWRMDFMAQLLSRDFRNSSALDGYRADLQFNLDRFLDSRSFVRFLGSGIREKAQRDDLTFHDATIGAGYFREWGWGISSYVQASLSGRWHHGDFAFAGEPRRDWRIHALLRIAKRDLALLGFAPYWQVGYTVNQSNIDLHDYKKLDLNVGWTRTF